MDKKPNLDQAKINYPCDWEYRIIGIDETLLKAAAAEIFGNRKYDLSFANLSKAGKYISLSIKTFVESEEVRNTIYAALAKHTAIKTVL
jgi:putative lipoic acid-binding regulatory protein